MRQARKKRLPLVTVTKRFGGAMTVTRINTVFTMVEILANLTKEKAPATSEGAGQMKGTIHA